MRSRWTRPTDRAILDQFGSALDATVLDAVVERTLARLDATSADGMARRQTLQAALQRVEAEIARYTAAIGAGGELDALVAALRAREEERKRIHELQDST